MNAKDEDNGELLAAVADILRSWCSNCRYKLKKEERNERDSDSNGDRHNNSDSKPIYCYFIKQNNWVKIGSSSDPIRRAETLSHYSPHKTRLIWYTTLVTESEMHKKWQHERVKGEWFRWSDALKSYITVLIERDRALDKKRDLNVEAEG